MARIRTIKPEMAQDEDLATVSIEAQLLAVRLLNQADDEGYFNANPALIKASCFPLVDSVNIPVALRELSDIGYLVVYDAIDGKRYGHLPTFTKHQVINKKTPSKYKELVILPDDYGSPPVVLPTGKEGKGTGKGKENILGPSGDGPVEDEDFERLWSKRPRRAGNDPKRDAQRCFNARRKEGDTVQDMEDGLERYSRFCEATGKINTEKVMQLRTFFGPAKPYEQPWTLPKRSSTLSDRNRGVIDSALGGSS